MNLRHATPPAMRARAALARRLVPALIALSCLILALGEEPLRELARYEREGILAGELWRLLSGHFVHLGWSHLWMNLAALAALGLLFGPLLSAADWAGATAAAAALIDLGLLALDPQVGWYVGLSGVLHGVLAAGGLRLAAGGSRAGLLLLAALALKLAFEQWHGPLPLSERAAGGGVVVNAHLYGAAGGALYVWLAGTVHGARGAPL